MMVIVLSAKTNWAGTVLHHRSIEASFLEFDLQDGDAFGALHRLRLQHQQAVIRKAALDREGRPDTRQIPRDPPAAPATRPAHIAGRKSHAMLPVEMTTGAHTPRRSRRSISPDHHDEIHGRSVTDRPASALQGDGEKQACVARRARRSRAAPSRFGRQRKRAAARCEPPPAERADEDTWDDAYFRFASVRSDDSLTTKVWLHQLDRGRNRHQRFPD